MGLLIGKVLSRRKFLYSLGLATGALIAGRAWLGRGGATAIAQIPTDPAVAMAGYYILFVMVDDIPSNGKIVRLTPN